MRLFLLPVIAGVVAGLSSSLFLHGLEKVTELRGSHAFMLLFLPFAGFLIHRIYPKGDRASGGMSLVLTEIKAPTEWLPGWMGAKILGTTWLTHLVGGSAGRESTAVQMGAALTDRLSSYLKWPSDERKDILVLGAGAGFAAAIATPWAGALFAFEFSKHTRPGARVVGQAIAAAQIGYWVATFLETPHTSYPVMPPIEHSFQLLYGFILFALALTMIVGFFIWLKQMIEWVGVRFFNDSALFPMTMGALLCLGFFFSGGVRYAGLGVDVILESFESTLSIRDAIFKSLFTAVTLGAGFKGGEFTPLVFMGATLGSALSAWLPVKAILLAAIGSVSAFGMAAHVPLTAAVMAIELFGWELAPYAWLVAFIGHKILRNTTIYSAHLPQ